MRGLAQHKAAVRAPVERVACEGLVAARGWLEFAGMALALIASIAFAPRAAGAVDRHTARDLSLSVDAGYTRAAVAASMPPYSANAFAAGLGAAYGLSDMFILEVRGTADLYAPYTFTATNPNLSSDQPASHDGPSVRDLRAFGASAALTYVIDLLRIMPFLTAGFGVDWLTQTMIYPSVNPAGIRVAQGGTELALRLGAGLDFAITDRLSAAAVVTYVQYLSGSTYYDGKLVASVRATAHFDLSKLFHKDSAR